MVSFSTVAAGGAAFATATLGTYQRGFSFWKSLGLSSVCTVVEIGVERLLGKKAQVAYLACVVIYAVSGLRRPPEPIATRVYQAIHNKDTNTLFRLLKKFPCAQPPNASKIDFGDPVLEHRVIYFLKSQWHQAIREGNKEALLHLLDEQPKIIYAFEPESGYTSLHTAAASGHIDIVELLLEKEPKLISRYHLPRPSPLINLRLTSLHVAAQNGHLDIIKLLFEKEPKLISIYENFGETPLHAAAAGGHTDIIEFLLEQDPGLISKYRTNDGYTPLHAAVHEGHTKTVQLLLQKDPDLISKYTVYDWTPLHSAAQKGHVEVGKLLYQADPQLLTRARTNDRKETPLMLATRMSQPKFIEWLKSVGAS